MPTSGGCRCRGVGRQRGDLGLLHRWQLGLARGSHIPALIDLVPQCPMILHYGEEDLLAPEAAIGNIRARRPAVELHVYQGAAHAFENVEQANYDAAASDLAWQRPIAFMDRHLASRP